MSKVKTTMSHLSLSELYRRTSAMSYPLPRLTLPIYPCDEAVRTLHKGCQFRALRIGLLLIVRMDLEIIKARDLLLQVVLLQVLEVALDVV